MPAGRTLLAVAVFTAVTLPAVAGRYEGYTDRVAKGAHATVIAATYFGSDGVEEFTAAAGLKDGKVVAFGNAWGPQFATQPKPLVLGSGRHSGAPALVKVTDKHGSREAPDDASPDRTGFFVVYQHDLTGIASVVRFDWGVGSITHGDVAPDGGLVVTGFAHRGINTLTRNARSFSAPAGPKTRDEGAGGQTSYVLKMTPEGRVDWLWVLNNHPDPPDIFWFDKKGNTYFEAVGLTRISPDGSRLDKVWGTGNGGQNGVRAVDPNTGEFYVGGDRNTNTGMEPWRQPYFYKFDPSGKRVDWVKGKAMGLWEWPSRGLRDRSLQGVQGDVSDSAIRFADWLPNGDLVVGCWSDGGNSVLGKQPLDTTRPVPSPKFSCDASGMKGANSLTHFIRVNPKAATSEWKGVFMGYCPEDFHESRYRGAPNGIALHSLKALPSGAFAICGAAATGLIQTPNAFWSYAHDGQKYGADFVTVFAPDMSGILFSSYLPGCANVRIGRTKSGVAAVSRSQGSDDPGSKKGTKSPTLNALQDKLRGAYDAHIVLINVPD